MLDSITRVKKNQTMKKDTRGHFFFQKMAAPLHPSISNKLNSVVGGTSIERDLSNSWCNERREGSGSSNWDKWNTTTLNSVSTRSPMEKSRPV